MYAGEDGSFNCFTLFGNLGLRTHGDHGLQTHRGSSLPGRSAGHQRSGKTFPNHMLDIIGIKAGRIVTCDIYLGGRGNSILIGPQKEELPFVDLRLVLDHLADLRPRVEGG